MKKMTRLTSEEVRSVGGGGDCVGVGSQLGLVGGAVAGAYIATILGNTRGFSGLARGERTLGVTAVFAASMAFMERVGGIIANIYCQAVQAEEKKRIEATKSK